MSRGLVEVGPGDGPFAPLVPHPLVVRRLFGDRFAADPGDPDVRPYSGSRALAELHLPEGLLDEMLPRLIIPAGPLRLAVRGVAAAAGRRSSPRWRASPAGGWGLSTSAMWRARCASPTAAITRALRAAALRGWFLCLIEP